MGAITETVAQEGIGKALMIVESNQAMQDALRERLKKHGYRVLVISDPARAFQRFEQAHPNEKVADALILFTHELGEAGIDWFNRFATLDVTKNLPAIILLGEKQAALKNTAKLDGHRVAMMMPLRLKELRQTLAKLLGLSLE